METSVPGTADMPMSEGATAPCTPAPACSGLGEWSATLSPLRTFHELTCPPEGVVEEAGRFYMAKNMSEEADLLKNGDCPDRNCV